MVDNDDISKLVALVERLAWADGLVTKEEALLITLHQGLWTGRLVWDVSALPAEKRPPVLDLIKGIGDGTHPALHGEYKPAREGEEDPGLPTIKPTLTIPIAKMKREEGEWRSQWIGRRARWVLTAPRSLARKSVASPRWTARIVRTDNAFGSVPSIGTSTCRT